MARILLCGGRPRHLGDAEGLGWLAGEAVRLAGIQGIRQLSLTPLDSPSLRQARPCDWLIEPEVDAQLDAADIVSTPVFSGLLADLRLLGMRPAVAMADAPREIRFSGGS